jgi:predicted dithiol-disulfide oxidoreductase (DUF899 family)
MTPLAALYNQVANNPDRVAFIDGNHWWTYARFAEQVRRVARGLLELRRMLSADRVYHFMFAPDWDEGCKSCSFWADNFNGIAIRLGHRDVTFTAVSRAPLAKISTYRRRMGWSFPWVSSFGSDFNFDFHASFAPAQIAEGKAYYNYEIRPIDVSDELGISVFSQEQRR